MVENKIEANISWIGNTLNSKSKLNETESVLGYLNRRREIATIL